MRLQKVLFFLGGGAGGAGGKLYPSYVLVLCQFIWCSRDFCQRVILVASYQKEIYLKEHYKKEQIFTDQMNLVILNALSPVNHFSWCSINKSASQIKIVFPFLRMCWAVDLQFVRWGQNNICWRTISILAWTATIFEILNFS